MESASPRGLLGSPESQHADDAVPSGLDGHLLGTRCGALGLRVLCWLRFLRPSLASSLGLYVCPRNKWALFLRVLLGLIVSVDLAGRSLKCPVVRSLLDSLVRTPPCVLVYCTV